VSNIVALQDPKSFHQPSEEDVAEVELKLDWDLHLGEMVCSNHLEQSAPRSGEAR
jgi:hypothetical protein